MVTDYARQSKSPQPNHKKRVIIILIVLAAIITPLAMHYIRYKKTVLPAKKTTQISAPKKRSASKPQFDFYTLLPKMNVPIPTMDNNAL
jgi:hypothetical protein